MKILVLNSGSSSQKSAVFDLEGPSDTATPPVWQTKIEWSESAALITTPGNGSQPEEERIPLERDARRRERREITRRMLEGIWSGPGAVVSSAEEIALVGHRIVHAGPHLRETAVITKETKLLIEKAEPFAPLHNQIELEGITLAQKIFPRAQQVAVFDTSFHRTLPLFAALYPGPYDWPEKGIIRYGFHGINHQYCAKRAARILHRDLNSLKIVTCHLGNGCSLAAIANGISVDTTMGFTPLDGLMMGTRSGAIDPAIVIYLARQYGMSPQEIDSILNHQSGLLGISGCSGDMREIVGQMKAGNARAQLAFEMFIHVLCKGIAAMAASLFGLDVLVFTAGIGENSAEVREAACEHLAFLGVKINRHRNASVKSDEDLSAPDSSVCILRIAAQEDWAIAQECLTIQQKAAA